MSKVKVLVFCQYWENKAFYCGGEAWSAKGGNQFVFNVDSDVVCYAEESLVEVIKEVIASKCDAGSRYAYISHEVFFHKWVDITDEVDERLEEKFKVGA
jgi:hypothetical protein